MLLKLACLLIDCLFNTLINRLINQSLNLEQSIQNYERRLKFKNKSSYQWRLWWIHLAIRTLGLVPRSSLGLMGSRLLTEMWTYRLNFLWMFAILGLAHNESSTVLFLVFLWKHNFRIYYLAKNLQYNVSN